LICTIYPPKTGGEKPVHNSFQAVKTRHPGNPPPELFTAAFKEKKRGE